MSSRSDSKRRREGEVGEAGEMGGAGTVGRVPGREVEAGVEEARGLDMLNLSRTRNAQVSTSTRPMRHVDL